MPTERPGTAITETDPVAAEPSADAAVAIAARLTAIDQASGILTGTYAPGHLADLRQDWAD